MTFWKMAHQLLIPVHALLDLLVDVQKESLHAHLKDVYCVELFNQERMSDVMGWIMIVMAGLMREYVIRAVDVVLSRLSSVMESIMIVTVILMKKVIPMGWRRAIMNKTFCRGSFVQKGKYVLAFSGYALQHVKR